MWGPTVWSALHVLSFAYPEEPTSEDRRSADRMVRGVIGLLPCEECRRHSREYLAASENGGDQFRNREAFARWIYDWHQSVNERIGGEARVREAPSFEQVRRKHRAMLGGCNKKAGCRIGRRQHHSVTGSAAASSFIITVAIAAACCGVLLCLLLRRQ